MNTATPSPDALIEAITQLGGVSRTAHLLNVTQPAVSNWLARGQVSVYAARHLERLTEGRVTREQLRPDVYGE